MKRLNRWADGASVEVDPRNEDPLVYYTLGNLAHAIGFRVEPLYKHEKASDVTISLAPQFLERATALATSDRQTMYIRMFETLSSRFTGWTRVRISIDDQLIGESTFTDAARQLGWVRAAVQSPGQACFVRT